MASAMMVGRLRRALASDGAQQCWALAKFGCFLHCIHEYVLEVSHMARARSRARSLAAPSRSRVLREALAFAR